MSRFGIIIQARSGSRRLPGKIFYKIGDLTILEHVLNRIKKTSFNKKIIIASSQNKKNKKIIKIAKKTKCNYFFGSENNVINRFYLAAKKYKIISIMRISADSPFIDPKILDKAYKVFKNNKVDIVTNILNPSFPKGMSVEVFNYEILEKLNKLAKSKSDKEHVTKYIYRNRKKFKIKDFKLNRSLRKFNFSVDTFRDLKKMRVLFSKMTDNKIEKKFKLENLINL